MTINLDAVPYHDDFDASKNYHKILFAPGHSIQSRELTQIQSIIQNQIKQHGDFIFKDGAMVIPGNIAYQNKVPYVKLQDTQDSLSVVNYLDNFTSKVIVGATTGVKAKVIHVEKSTDTDPNTLFVSYISGGYDENDVNYTTFMAGEAIQIEDDSGIVVSAGLTDDYIGLGSLSTIVKGVYYINGYFIQNETQTIVLDKYSTEPSYQVGLNYIETIVTAADDESLADNSAGFTNAAAPGADRLKITLELVKYDYFTKEVTPDFYPLLWVKDGKQERKVAKTNLSKVGDILAKRTFEESGDYLIDRFQIDLTDYRSNNRGEWSKSTHYVANDVVTYSYLDKTFYMTALNSGTSAVTYPVQTYGEYIDGSVRWIISDKPNYNTGSYQSKATDTLEQQIIDANTAEATIYGGKMYLKGYEIDLTEGFSSVQFDKTRTYEYANNKQTKCNVGPYFKVNNLFGLPIISPITGIGNTALEKYNILDKSNNIIGYCRIRNIEFDSGSIGDATAVYRLYFFDMNIYTSLGYDFKKHAASIKSANNTSFSVNIIGNRKLQSGTVSNTLNSNTVSGDGTLFSAEFSVGETVVIKNTTTESKHVIVSITDSVAMTVTPAIPYAFSRAQIYTEYATQYGNNTLIQKLPKNNIASLRTDNGSLSMTYYVRRSYQAQAQNGKITLNLANPNESFAPVNAEFYMTTMADGTGSIINGTTIELSGLNNSQLTISGLTGSNTYRILATIKKTKEAAKEKEKQRKFETIELTTLNTARRAVIALGESDVTRIISIKQSGSNNFDTSAPNDVKEYEELGETDITSKYKLRINTTDLSYKMGAIVVNGTFQPAAPIRIVFEYYEHGQGDFFSVDSYKVPYDMMPVWNNELASDYIDFRPRFDDSGAGFDLNNGASIPEPLSSVHDIDLSYSYYLPRRDILQVTTDATFRIEQGKPNEKPVAPIANDNSLIIAYLSLPAYLTNCKTIDVNYVSVNRYTMGDIAKIDQNLTNAEDALLSNMLDADTKNLVVTDEFGLDRFKLGLLTNPFKDHSVGNIHNPDYKVAIDPVKQECRPQYVLNDVKLVEDNSLTRAANHYQITGELVTLPYTHQVMIQNTRATSGEHVAPLMHLSTKPGLLNIYPQYDTWVGDVDILPTVSNVADTFDTTVQNLKDFGIGTKYPALDVPLSSSSVPATPIGTSWNAWQEVARTTIATQTSVSVTPSYNTRVLSLSPVGNEISRTETIQTRTDATTTTINGTDAVTYQRLGSALVAEEHWDTIGAISGMNETKWTPWCRQKTIVLYAKGMMPKVRLYPRVDQVDLSAYCTPATSIYFSSKTGNFLDYKSSGISFANQAERQYLDKSYDTFNKGEVIRGQTSGATAITVAEELEAGIQVLKVINIKGTFSTGETIRGLTSGATCVFTSKAQDNLQTNVSGSFFGILTIPCDQNIRFPAQILAVRLSDSENSVDTTSATTSGLAYYDAHGITYSKQTTIMSVRSAVLTRRNVSETTIKNENWTKSSTTYKTTTLSDTVSAVNCNCDCNCDCGGGSGGGGGDPLAQSFIHNFKGGVFLTKIDLYFHTLSQSEKTPIWFHIVESVNGMPGDNIVPFSTVIKMPHEITNVSSTELLPTTFTFESPVYLSNDVEYCFVLGTNYDTTMDTKVWVSRMGEVSIQGDVVIQQPLMGSFFRSQNNITWEAQQLNDLCFTAYYAKFDISQYGHIKLVNQKHNADYLPSNPFKVINGTTLVRVEHFNHGLKNGDLIVYSGASDSAFNKRFMVANVDLDSYTINLTANATTTGWIGGSSVMATPNKKADVIYVSGNDFVLPGTHINYTYRPTNSSGIKEIKDYGIELKRNAVLDDPIYLFSSENENKYLAGDNSFDLDAYLYSHVETLSPVIDLPTLSLHTISNRINNPSAAINLSVDLDTIISAATITGGTAFSSSGYIEISDSNYFVNYDAIQVGKYIKFTGSGLTNTQNILVTGKSHDTTYRIYTTTTLSSQTFTGAITLQQYDNYVDFISPHATSNAASYVSPIMSLQNTASSFKLFVEYNLRPGASIDIYYRAVLKSSFEELENKNWIKLNETFDYSDYREVFTEKEIDADIDNYDEISFKIVFRSTVTSIIPRIKNLRVLTLA